MTASGDRTRVQVLDDVGQIFGTDGRDYDLHEGDVVELPRANADALIERDAAEPVAPFTHVGLGTQFDPPDDIVSRCIQIQTTPADRDVPVWFDEDRATNLRNRLLYARYRLLESDEWDEAEQTALDSLNDRGLTGRLREKLLSLVAVAELWDNREAIEPFVKAMEQEAEEAATESDDALFIRAVRDLAFDELGGKAVIGDADPWEGLTIPLTDVRDRFNDMTDRDVNATYMGQIRARLDLEKTRHSDGVVIKDEDLREKLSDLCEQNNLDWEHSGYHDPVRPLDDSEKGKRRCSECGRDRFLICCRRFSVYFEGEIDYTGVVSSTASATRQDDGLCVRG